LEFAVKKIRMNAVMWAVLIFIQNALK